MEEGVTGQSSPEQSGEALMRIGELLDCFVQTGADVPAEESGSRPADPRELSPLVLAFLGDGVYDLIIRTAVVLEGNRPVRKLHRDKAAFVNAHAQAMLAERILPALTAEEADVLRRGRNAHNTSSAKNQSVADYHAATGLEALCGFLYLTGQMDRLLALIRIGLAGEGSRETAAGEEREQDE